MNRPAIVAGVAANVPAARRSRRATPPTLVLAVKFIDGQLLSDISARFDLPNLRTVGEEPAQDGENVTVLSNSAGTRDRALRLDAEPAGRQDRLAPCCRSWRSPSAASRC